MWPNNSINKIFLSNDHTVRCVVQKFISKISFHNLFFVLHLIQRINWVTKSKKKKINKTKKKKSYSQERYIFAYIICVIRNLYGRMVDIEIISVFHLTNWHLTRFVNFFFFWLLLLFRLFRLLFRLLQWAHMPLFL